MDGKRVHRNDLLQAETLRERLLQKHYFRNKYSEFLGIQQRVKSAPCSPSHSLTVMLPFNTRTREEERITRCSSVTHPYSLPHLACGLIFLKLMESPFWNPCRYGDPTTIMAKLFVLW